jgi:hypothetical protein
LNRSNISIHFSGNYVVLDRQGIVLDDETLPMDKDHFFFLRYLYKGEEINKKLSFSGDTLIIDKAALFTVDGKPIPSSDNTLIKLYYRNGNESAFMSEFNLIFPDIKQLLKEIEIILQEFKDKSPDAKTTEIYSYINEFYGKVSRDDLAKWLQTRFEIK